MDRDNLMDLLKQKLQQIEKNMEEDNGRAKLNRMPARYFMFFFVFGKDEEEKRILERKVKALLCNPDACEILYIRRDPEISYGKQAEDVLKNAADKHIDVTDLNTVFLCPVIFAGNEVGAEVLPILKEIDAYMNRSGHEAVWQPTVIIEKNVSEYKNIYFAVSEIKRFITEMPEGRVNRCLLLSNLDENGFVVPQENLMQTVAMTVMLQNVVSKNSGDSQNIRSRVNCSSTKEDGKDLFFTARNAAVTNPIRSLLLQRMASAITFFSKKHPDNSAMARIDYTNVFRIMSRYLSKLPQCGGRITLFPLYSVMADASLHRRLEQVIREKYVEPLCGDGVRKNQLDEAKAWFLRDYFLQNGSLAGLKEVLANNLLEHDFLQHKMDCYDVVPLDAPVPDRKKLGAFIGGEYESAHRYCEELIRGCGWKLLEDTAKQLTQPEMLHRIDSIEETMEFMKDCIHTRLRQLKDVETVLVVEQTEQRTEFDDVQSSWLENAVLNNPTEYAASIRRFDEIVYNLLLGNTADYGAMLEVCYEAIRKSAYSNNEYLNRVSEECMVNEERAGEFAETVEKNWCYTLRFLTSDETKDATCIIGDSRNAFCKILREKFKGTLFDFNGFDRIDVLHISGAFSPENLLEWKQIEEVGKGVQA